MSQPALDLDLDDGGEPTYTVAELTDAVNATLQRRFGDGVWVRGEVAGWSERGPHAYFTLVEETDRGKAVLNVQWFAPSRQRLEPVLRRHGLRLTDGLRVRIHGHLDVYAATGRFGLKMAGIDPRFTIGDLAVQRAEVVRRLVAAGLYDANRRVPMAIAPLRVGVITSIDGAAWADFRHEIERSGFGFHLLVRDVRVQGERAVEMVSAAVGDLGRSAVVDVLVLIRGGGARNDLAVFDHQDIATAVAACPVPVLTGLGHEVDRSVADEVAHTALKTPTACAAALVEQVAAVRDRAEEAWGRIAASATDEVRRGSERLDRISGLIGGHVRTAVEVSDERLGQRAVRLRVGALRALDRAAARIGGAADATRRAPARLTPEERHLDAVAERLRLLDPATTLARGWSITRAADGRTVRDASTLRPGDTIVSVFAKGEARSTVEDTRP